MLHGEEKLLLKLMSECKRVDNLFATYRGHWDNIYRYIYPTKDNMYDMTDSHNYNRQRFIFDNTAQHSLDLLASFLFYMLFNPTKNWLKWGYGVEEIDEDMGVRKFLQSLNKAANYDINRSNFYSEIYPWLKNCLSIGNGLFLINDLPDNRGVVYKNLSLGPNSFSISNIDYAPNKVFRRHKMTYVDMFMKFGEEKVKRKLPEQVRKNLERNDAFDYMMKPQVLRHIIYPKEELDFLQDTISTINKKYLSIYVLEDYKTILDIKGFDDHPKHLSLIHISEPTRPY